MNLVSLLQSIGLVANGATPNAGPSLENIVFDPTLYALTTLIAFVAILTTVICLRRRSRFADQRQRSRIIGTGMVALGYCIVVVAAITLLTLLRAELVGGFLYLQVEFVVAYLASAMILYGVDKTVFPIERSANHLWSGRREIGVRVTLWVSFLISVVIALAYLLNPFTYTTASTGITQHVAQQGVFWLPAFVVVATAALTLSVFAVRHSDGAIRRHSVYLSFFFLLVPIGMSKESNLIPSFGDPLVDMLVAFVPFTVGSFCLFVGATRLRPVTPAPSVGSGHAT